MTDGFDKRITKIKDNVYHIYDSVDAFYSLIVGTKYALLIDSGYGFSNVHDIVKTITDLPIMIVNTHGHIDHTQGNKSRNNFV